MKLGSAQAKDGFVRRYALYLSVLAICFYLGFVSGSWHQNTLQKELSAMGQSTNNLVTENQQLRSQINEMKIALDVSQLSNEQQQKRLKELMQNTSALKEQLGFYQRVMAPELNQEGFVVERLEVVPTSSTNNFALSMILLQHENIKEQVTGELAIELHGSMQGQPKRFKLAQLLDNTADSLKFAFKYFEVLNTSMTLPEDFVPERFEITTDVYKYKRKQGSYSTSITWDEAFSQSE